MATEAYLREMGALLTFHQIIPNANALTEADLEDAITRFQASSGLFADGIAGPNTLWALQYPYYQARPQLKLVKVPADRIAGDDGYDHIALREDAANRLMALRDEVTLLGGRITSAGGLRPLATQVSAGRSALSMHYAGIAFDLSLTSGFFNPDHDVFVVTRDGPSHWTVWCRADGGQERALDAVYWQSWNSGVDLTKQVHGRFINFTEACGRHGFHRIGSRGIFRREADRNYIGAEWWHFQANDELTPDISQFGVEMLRIDGYSPQTIAQKNPAAWANRRAIFRLSWN